MRSLVILTMLLVGSCKNYDYKTEQGKINIVKRLSDRNELILPPGYFDRPDVSKDDETSKK